jgi:hypothetical protein
MRSKSLAPYLVRVAAVTALGLALGGCSYLREAAGMNKMAPDEFAVLTKAPLTIPPDFGLMPPKPGAAPTNQIDPGTNAQSSLFGADAATVAANIPGHASMGEKLLLANANAANADSAIRQQIAADEKDMLATDDKFTDELMFWQDKAKEPTDVPVNADAEAARLAAAKGQPPKPAPVQNQNSLPQAAPADEDTGWFGGLFDWF